MALYVGSSAWHEFRVVECYSTHHARQCRDGAKIYLMDIAYSIANVPIRLTHERWFHIVENQDEMAGYYDDVLTAVEDPEMVLSGYGSALIAVRSYGKNRYLNVIYRELSPDDGFIITAFFTSNVNRSRLKWKSP